ncbi:MAG: NADPH-dependent FMN reductase [Pyrinomonadaceae bacterium]
MADMKLNIPVLLGTSRQARQSEHVARWLMTRIALREDMRSSLFDVRDFHLPYDNYGQEIKDEFPDWRDAIIAADGLIIVTPEYNHGPPGPLKSVLDLLLREYVHKPVAFAAVSAQVWGGTRVIETMLHIVRELGLAATFTDLNFPRVQDKFDAEGNLLDEAYNSRADAFLNELAWMATTYRWGRQNVPSQFH